jgi:Transposase DNA-binding
MPSEKIGKRRQPPIADAKSQESWVDRELAECDFKDERLRKRFRMLLEQLSDGTGESIPMACQDGYLARASDPPQGNIVMWRGLARLTDIELGFILGATNVGN